MQVIVDKAIVLRRTNYGEADRIITFLAENSGKVTVLAKGVRKPKSKLAGGVEPFCVSEISFVKGRSDISTLTGSKIISYYPTLVSSIDKITKASEAIRVVDRHIEDFSSAEYFYLIKEYIASLNDVTQTATAEMWWLVRLMMLTGHDINLRHETDGSKFSEKNLYSFDFDNAGFFSHNQGLFSPPHIKLLKLSQANSPSALGRINNCNNLAGQLVPMLKNFSKLQIG